MLDEEQINTFNNNCQGVQEESERINCLNKEIIEVYNTTLPKLLPDYIELKTETPTYAYVEEMKRKIRRKKKHFFKKECGRRSSIIERYLERQLVKQRKRTIGKYANNCMGENNVDSDIEENHNGDEEEIDVRGEENHIHTGDEEEAIDIDAEEEIADITFERRNRNLTKRETVVTCINKGEPEVDGSLTMCKECSKITYLGARHFPPYINEVTCGSRNSDRFCFANEGLCVQNTIYVTFLYDRHNLGMDSLYRWEQYSQPIAISCSCQLMKQSIFANLVNYP